MQVLGPLEFAMKRRTEASDEPLKKRKNLRDDSSDEDEESSQRTTSQGKSRHVIFSMLGNLTWF